MKLDIKGIKIPSKEIKLNILDQELEVTIYPITGFGLSRIQAMSEELQKNSEDPEIQEKLVRFAVKYGCKADDETIEFLVENDLFASMKLVEEIMLFSNEYNSKKYNQVELAKKKLKK